jgi:hypothetical protein
LRVFVRGYPATAEETVLHQQVVAALVGEARQAGDTAREQCEARRSLDSVTSVMQRVREGMRQLLAEELKRIETEAEKDSSSGVQFGTGPAPAPSVNGSSHDGPIVLPVRTEDRLTSSDVNGALERVRAAEGLWSPQTAATQKEGEE